MESKAAVETVEAIGASVSALAVFVDRAVGSVPLNGDEVPRGSSVPGLDPLRDQADAYLDRLAELARTEARLAALKVQLVAGYARTEKAMTPPAASPQDCMVRDMAVTAEVAGVLTISERAAGNLQVEANILTAGRPLTMAALQAGAISWQHARIMVDETENLDPAGAAELEAHFLDPDAPDPARGCPAGELVPCRFRAKVRTWRERHHPGSIEKRHARSSADRRVEYTPDSDGMAWFSAYLPAAQAVGIWNRTTDAARAMQGPGEARTLTQLRADVTSTWLLTAGRRPKAEGNTGSAIDGITDEFGAVPSPAAQALVTVPVFSLLGLTGEPAMLDGYGPIPPSMARALVAGGAASFLRVLTDPRDGAPLEIGHISYRLTKPMRQWLRLRDAKCTFPACNNHSLDNDADHLLAWARGGPTGISNLGQSCPKHHRLKHNSGWTPAAASTNDPPGWTSPAGRHYRSEQPDWEPPHWPPQIQAMLDHLDPPDEGDPCTPEIHGVTERPVAEVPFGNGHEAA
ncbi:HNH endonuclease signature motif containing protein [Arthrobacter globiformis]|uniref:HNH endonuclease signature motif containing protein n=1 Tax=Arthrobacter globiformis TaxID=1665 RepID=UPI000B40E97C|nr:HNH endonuclease signature motif containing protein [Arthrobacter globiformis]